MDWFLDCYHDPELVRNDLPVTSYGPAGQEEIENLKIIMMDYYHRVEMTNISKHPTPMSKNSWNADWLVD